LLGFKTMQNHFWNQKYKYARFIYQNYFDIVNAFFILSILKNT
jgi:hypothetical protein